MSVVSRTERIRRSIALVSIAIAVLCAACDRGNTDRPPPARAPTRAQSAARAPGDTSEEGGEIVESGDSSTAGDTTKPMEKWLSDANVLAMLGLMNTRQLSASDIEIQSWHSELVRDFATATLHAHAALQRGVDSLVDRIHVAPVAPALEQPLGVQMQAQIDSLFGHGAKLDRAYVSEQVSSNQLMAETLKGLAGVAERPEVQSAVAAMASVVAANLAHATALEAQLAQTDSVAAADSAAKDSARAERLRRKGGG